MGLTARSPHVYTRSALQAQRNVEQENQGDYVPAARAVLAALPALLLDAEAGAGIKGAQYPGWVLN